MIKKIIMGAHKCGANSILYLDRKNKTSFFFRQIAMPYMYNLKIATKPFGNFLVISEKVRIR